MCLSRRRTFSIGVAQIDAGDTNETLLKRIDQALYAAKNSGSDRVVCFTEADEVA